MALKNIAEQRASSRINLMFHTQVVDCATDRSIGVLCDISLHGMRVIGDHVVAPGELLRVRVPLPVDSGETNDIELSCQCRWSYRDPTIDGFHTGLQMQNVDAETTRLLESLIEEFGFSDLLGNFE